MENNKNHDKNTSVFDGELRTVTLLRVAAIFLLIAGIIIIIDRVVYKRPDDYSAYAILCFISSILLYALSHIVSFLNKINENLEAIKNKTVPKEIDKETNNND